ncbi:hypothetical protein L211DRAFT_848833 [Terfezia boudieri ATCC MYA-4762]|uniref:assimilatory sulfite reductase (NADPH) n=1 Tax=Terfezia boudieri ATCC MYA-4762 TaxID=1051890 RepID=A0A3N4LNQ8_9PEZI|nr:hypothetical protein L211DRAFT_848833 [Terfezia boudieri ATCC MYA-4762]
MGSQQVPVTKTQMAGRSEASKKKVGVSPAFPFSVPPAVAVIGGPTYTTAQTLVQQVAYSLSDKVFTYSPETFGLDCAVKQWAGEKQVNASGRATAVTALETRLGAGSALLGYTFSKDKTSKKELPQTVIATTATLGVMQPVLNQLSLLYALSSPVVAHVAAIDYDTTSGSLVTDYASAINVTRETGVGLVASTSIHESQHMALFATLAASVLPTVHIYDGLKLLRESTRVVDVLDQRALAKLSAAVLKEQQEVSKNADQVCRVSQILQTLNAELGTAYSFFEYEGHTSPDAVLVVLGSVEASLATQLASTIAKAGEKVGVIAVRLITPFSEAHFIKALPKSVKRVVVLGQVQDEIAVEDDSTQSALFTDVFSAIIMSDSWVLPPPVFDIKYSRSRVWSSSEFRFLLEQIAQVSYTGAAIPAHVPAFDVFTVGNQFIFWDTDNAVTANAPATLAKLLAGDSSKNVSFIATYDNGPQAGVIQSEIRTSRRVLEAPHRIQSADVSVVNDIKLLGDYDVAATVRQGGTVLLVSNVAAEDYEKKLPAAFRRALVYKNINFVILNPQAVETVEDADAFKVAVTQLAFLQLIGANAARLLMGLLQYTDSAAIQLAAQELDRVMHTVEVPKTWAEDEVAETEIALPAVPTATSFTINAAKLEEEAESFLRTPQTVAQAFSFKEAFKATPALRPDLGMKNFVVKVRERKRLTPEYYDRNVFHIEFDISGTGLTYNIGEALGIHQHNDENEVSEFIRWYGLDPKAIVEVPSREDPENTLEVRTVYQALLQNIDMFGKPGKKFYESLAEFATNAEEKKALLTLSSPEGTVEFKRRAEVDTVTYADIFREFPSAHPAFYDLAKIVSPLKRREYSIASAQIVNPDSVHLLIVAVDWIDSRGRKRMGQATRYLSSLSKGSEVTVSVKPSVMKLPPASTAPLVMAGLGTGLAPFRAFCQYRAWQKEQGLPIGPILLYMGSRHQREEYLYGEEWEAYKTAGIVTLLGTAFSRDQKEKIYIQDRMRQSIEDIVKAFVKEEGSFYLCGPTWPVPDVAQVLVEAIEKDAVERGSKIDARRRLEELKDHERYVLEVIPV